MPVPLFSPRDSAWASWPSWTERRTPSSPGWSASTSSAKPSSSPSCGTRCLSPLAANTCSLAATGSRRERWNPVCQMTTSSPHLSRTTWTIWRASSPQGTVYFGYFIGFWRGMFFSLQHSSHHHHYPTLSGLPETHLTFVGLGNVLSCVFVDVQASSYLSHVILSKRNCVSLFCVFLPGRLVKYECSHGMLLGWQVFFFFCSPCVGCVRSCWPVLMK